MKLYGDYPHAWGRIKSIDVTPAEYACSVERTSTDYSPRWWLAMAVIALVTVIGVAVTA